MEKESSRKDHFKIIACADPFLKGLPFFILAITQEYSKSSYSIFIHACFQLFSFIAWEKIFRVH